MKAKGIKLAGVTLGFLLVWFCSSVSMASHVPAVTDVSYSPSIVASGTPVTATINMPGNTGGETFVVNVGLFHFWSGAINLGTVSLTGTSTNFTIDTTGLRGGDYVFVLYYNEEGGTVWLYHYWLNTFNHTLRIVPNITSVTHSPSVVGIGVPVTATITIDWPGMWGFVEVTVNRVGAEGEWLFEGKWLGFHPLQTAQTTGITIDTTGFLEGQYVFVGRPYVGNTPDETGVAGIQFIGWGGQQEFTVVDLYNDGYSDGYNAGYYDGLLASDAGQQLLAILPPGIRKNLVDQRGFAKP